MYGYQKKVIGRSLLHYDTDLDRLVSFNELDMVVPNSNVPYIDRVKLYLKDNFNMGDIIGRIIEILEC